MANVFSVNGDNVNRIKIYDYLRVPIRSKVFDLVIKTFYKVHGFFLILEIDGEAAPDFLTPNVSKIKSE